MSLLPQKLGGAEKNPRSHLPSHYVAPLIHHQGQIAIGVNPLRKHVVDDGFRGGSHDEWFFEFLAAAVRDRRHFRSETLDVLCFLTQKALRNEQWEVGVARAGPLDAAVQFVAQRLPDCEPVRPKHDTSAHRRVIRQFSTQDDVVVPGGEILAAGCYFAFILVGHRRVRSSRGRQASKSPAIIDMNQSPCVRCGELLCDLSWYWSG